MGLSPVQPWARWARPLAIQDAEVLRPRLPPVLGWREGKRFAPETLNKLAGGNAPSLFRREAPGGNRLGIEAAPAGPLTPKRFAKTIQFGRREGSASGFASRSKRFPRSQTFGTKRFAQRQQKQMARNIFGALSEALRSQPPAVFILDSEKREALRPGGSFLTLALKEAFRRGRRGRSGFHRRGP